MLSYASFAVDPALVPPICAVMRTGSLETLCVGLPPQVVEQVLKELPHCTQLRELELELELKLDVSKVRHVTLYSTHQMNSYCTSAHVVRLGVASSPGSPR